MADEQRKHSVEFGEAVLRELITDTLTELLNLPASYSSREKLGELLMDYGYSTRARGITLESEVLAALRESESIYSQGEEGDELIEERVLTAIDAIIRQQKLRAASAQPPRMVTVEIHSSLIDDLRAEAEDMELNTLGTVPGPVAAVLAALEAAAEVPAENEAKEAAETREESIDGAIVEERGHEENLAEDIEIASIIRERVAAGGATPLDELARKLGVKLTEALPLNGSRDFADEEKIPVLEGMAVRSRADLDDEEGSGFPIPAGFLWVVNRVQGDSIELESRTVPGVGLNMDRKDFWAAFSFASDVVQPGEVLAEIKNLAAEERAQQGAEFRAELSSTISQGVSKVAESAAKLNERYGPVGERIFKKAVSAAKSAVTARVQETAPSETADSKVLSEAFSDGAFEDASEREIDLQALREKLASTAKVRSTESKVWDAPRDQLAQLIYDAQHPDQGSKWLTTVDGSPNIVSYEAADAVLERFPDLFASSGDGAESDAENSSERSGKSSDDLAGKQESESIGPKLEDFPLPVPPAETDLERFEYLQRALDLDDFEDSFRRDDALAELLELLPNAIAEIRYLRDNEGEIQKSFAETLEKLQDSVNTSSVRHAWEAYEEAIRSRDLLYDSRQLERATVRRLEGELEELKRSIAEQKDSQTPAEKLAAWTTEADRKEREAINQSSVNSYNRWAESQRELGHVASFTVSGIPMAVKISEQEGTTLKLLELIPQGSESPLFRKEICATGFLTEEKLRRIVMDSDGWLGNDAVEVASQSESSSAEDESPSAEAAPEEGEG